jgi:molecular chaperone GrpE
MNEPSREPTDHQVSDTNATEPAQAATAVLEDLESLRARAEKAELERGEFKDLLLRTRADFENYQKRMHRDLAQERRYAHGLLAGELLPVLDNLERATAAAQQAGETGPLVQGVALVHTLLLNVFKHHGVSPIEALGKPFDPNLHQAVMQQATAEAPPGTVVQVIEQGYTIHERVLRPARVVVSVAPETGSAG